MNRFFALFSFYCFPFISVPKKERRELGLLLRILLVVLLTAVCIWEFRGYALLEGDFKTRLQVFQASPWFLFMN